jgi:hypothetical protein
VAGSIGYSACHPVRRDSSTATTALFPDFASKTIRSAAGHSDSRMALMRPIIKTNEGCDVPKASGLGAVKWTLRSGWHHLDPVRPVPRLRATRSHRRHSHRPTRSDHRRTSPAAIPIEPAAPPQLTVPRVPSLNASGSPPLRASRSSIGPASGTLNTSCRRRTWRLRRQHCPTADMSDA